MSLWPIFNVADAAIRALPALLGPGRARELVIRKVDGVPVGESPWRDRLTERGFVSGYRGLTLRSGRGPGA